MKQKKRAGSSVRHSFLWWVIYLTLSTLACMVPAAIVGAAVWLVIGQDAAVIVTILLFAAYYTQALFRAKFN